MNIGRATEYRNTSHLFIGVNLLKIVAGAVECRRHSNGGAEGADGSGVWGGVSPSPVGVRSGAQENFFFDFSLRNVELLCILDSGAGR